MLKKVFALLLYVFSLTSFAGNLLLNGDFDDANFRKELSTNWLSGTAETSLFIEDLNWNRCLRFEIKNVPEKDSVRSMYAIMLFGKEEKTLGFSVKPETIYQVSFEIRGTVPSLGVRASLWNKDSTSIWDGLSSADFENVEGIKVSEEWSRIQGTFKTAADTKRAALRLQFWGDSARQQVFKWEVGQYLLVDNISVREKTNLAADVPQLDTSASVGKKVIALPAEKISSFNIYGKNEAAPVSTDFSISTLADSLQIDIDCKSSQKVRANVSENSRDIWKDDLLEVFFGPSYKNDRLLSQFVISAGGGRYMGNGPAEIFDYDSWKAETKVTANGWTARLEIPYKLLGYDTAPKAGELLGFNICRQDSTGFSTWANVKNGFHDPDNFNYILFGNKADYVKSVLRELGDCPEDALDLWNSFASAEEDLQELYVQADLLRQTIKNIKLGQSTYLLGVPEISSDFTLPFNLEFDTIKLDERSPINIRASVNEVYPLPLTITNRTDKSASYRVMIHPNVEYRLVAQRGLEGGFPGNQIEMYEAIPMKDGDNENPTIRFDALPLMNQSKIIHVAAGETGLVWVNFNCRDVAPGTYKGAIRILPMNEAAKMDKGIKYSGPAKDYPLNLEVLPIELPMDNPEYPSWLMTRCETESMFEMQSALGGRFVGINPWAFRYTFDEKGEITSGLIIPWVLESIKERLGWMEKYPYENGLKFFVHFSTYYVFERQFLNKKIVIGSPEWENAWKNNLKGIEAHFKAAGLKNSEWGFEVFDEPFGKNLEKDLEVSRIARETLPDVFQSITWAAPNFGHTPDTIRRFMPYVDDHCFWGGHLRTPAYRELAKEIRASGKGYGMYSCSTSMRESLYRYFRLHPWKALEFGADTVGLYTFVNGPTGTAGTTSWKIASSGGIAYRSEDDCIGSIRLENFRQGMIDLAYLSVLKKLAVGDSKLAKDARKFLAEAPDRAVIKHGHNAKIADQLRNETIEYIMKLQKE